jgi:hypothetical protein
LPIDFFPKRSYTNMTMDELLDELLKEGAVMDSHDVARIFNLPHDLVLSEVEQRRDDPAFVRAVCPAQRAEYRDCWFIEQDGRCLRHVEMNGAGLTWLVAPWQIPQVAEYSRALTRHSQALTCLTEQSRVLQ